MIIKKVKQFIKKEKGYSLLFKFVGICDNIDFINGFRAGGLMERLKLFIKDDTLDWYSETLPKCLYDQINEMCNYVELTVELKEIQHDEPEEVYWIDYIFYK